MTCTATTTWYYRGVPPEHAQPTTAHACTLTGEHELHRCACGIQWRTIRNTSE